MRPSLLCFLALAACAPADEDAYPFDKIRDGDPSDTGEDDTGEDDTGEDAEPDPFAVTFEGVVATVSGAPFGFGADIRETRVSGSFTWNRALPDTDEDPDRGLYDHAGSGAFTLSVGGRVVGGSAWPQVEVENLSSDTFRFVDGAAIFGRDEERPMTVDGVEDPAVGVWFAITDGDGAVFADDDLPTAWPFPDVASYPHTFSVEDADGTLLLQLDAAGPG